MEAAENLKQDFLKLKGKFTQRYLSRKGVVATNLQKSSICIKSEPI